MHTVELLSFVPIIQNKITNFHPMFQPLCYGVHQEHCHVHGIHTYGVCESVRLLNPSHALMLAWSVGIYCLQESDITDGFSDRSQQSGISTFLFLFISSPDTLRWMCRATFKSLMLCWWLYPGSLCLLSRFYDPMDSKHAQPLQICLCGSLVVSRYSFSLISKGHIVSPKYFAPFALNTIEPAIEPCIFFAT